jgi:hypothetical protein
MNLNTVSSAVALCRSGVYCNFSSALSFVCSPFFSLSYMYILIRFGLIGHLQVHEYVLPANCYCCGLFCRLYCAVSMHVFSFTGLLIKFSLPPVNGTFLTCSFAASDETRGSIYCYKGKGIPLSL